MGQILKLRYTINNWPETYKWTRLAIHLYIDMCRTTTLLGNLGQTIFYIDAPCAVLLLTNQNTPYIQPDMHMQHNIYFVNFNHKK